MRFAVTATPGQFILDKNAALTVPIYIAWGT